MQFPIRQTSHVIAHAGPPSQGSRSHTLSHQFLSAVFERSVRIRRRSQPPLRRDEYFFTLILVNLFTTVMLRGGRRFLRAGRAFTNDPYREHRDRHAIMELAFGVRCTARNSEASILNWLAKTDGLSGNILHQKTGVVDGRP